MLPAGTHARPTAPPASSTRSPRWAWSRPCSSKATSALVHTAAASNLGQMLNKICLAGRHRPGEHRAQAASRRSCCASQGAQHVCDSSAPSFMDDLTEALAATGATLAFDAIGGGKLAGQILTCMEAAINRNGQGVQPLRLGRAQAGLHLRRLDTGPTEHRCATSAWPGAWAAGCCSRSCRRSALPRRRRCASAWPPSSRPLSPATTPHRVAGRGADARGDRRLRKAGHRREVPDRPEPRPSATTGRRSRNRLRTGAQRTARPISMRS